MRKCTKNWTCKDGRKVRICDMTDSHLANTIAFLERVASQQRQQTINAAYSCAATLQGEMASYYAEQDIDRMEQSSDDEWLHPLYDDLVGERTRREIISLQLNS